MMHRLTTDTPKDNFEMALNLFYVKDKEVWVRGYGKGGADISLLNLTREILSHQCPYVESDISDDDLIMMMPEWLFDDVRATEHVIGLLYQAAWVCAELREHLKQFEDSRLSPEDAANLHAILRLGNGMTLMRLRELAVADQEGRVIVPPCKRGDELWTFCNYPCKRVYSFTVSDVSTLNGRTVLHTQGLGTIRSEDIGKTVFLTREEAEKALAEMEGMKE